MVDELLAVICDCLINIVSGFSAVSLETGGRPQSVGLGADCEVTVCQRLGHLNYSDPDLCQQVTGISLVFPIGNISDIYQKSHIAQHFDKSWVLQVQVWSWQ